MKKTILFLVFVCFLVLNSVAQTTVQVPKYKMYQTENIQILLKLDTSTGAIWMVQFAVKSRSERIVVPLDNTSLLNPDEKEIPGRFELYPTKNMHNFILLDTKLGTSYQVQWSTNPNESFREVM